MNEAYAAAAGCDAGSRWNWRSTRCAPGNRLFDICGAVEKHVTANGFSVVREYVGHGIGTSSTRSRRFPNYVDRKNENPRLKEGMVLAIEPMVNAGEPDMRSRAGPLDGGDARTGRIRRTSSIAWR